MTTGSLFLHPAAPGAAPVTHRILQGLKEAGLIDQALPSLSDAFMVGPAFLQLITFMGCSPYIELEPPKNGIGDFCHIRIHHFRNPRLLFGTNTRPPRCPSCRKSMETDPRQVSALAEKETKPVFGCPHCGTRAALSELRWRQDAGFGDLFVEIRSVFPGEAVPVDSLMQRLAALTGCEWSYFYLTGNPV